MAKKLQGAKPVCVRLAFSEIVELDELMIKQLAHLCLYTDDLDRTAWFYEEVLGLERAFDFDKDGRPFGYYLKLGERTFLEVFRGEPDRENPGAILHMALEVSNIDEVIAKLREHDIDVSDKTLGCDHAWQCWARDPNGVRIEFHEYTPESMQLVGGVAQVDW